MCGIAGIASLRDEAAPDVALVRRMCDTIVHRGPDDEGVDVADGVALGMRRLSIIDLADGQQPYVSEDGSVRAVFNGEIYNFRELRAGLLARGHTFASHTDGEVIVHLWEEEGADFLARLNGMFALAVHDSRRRRLLLARDRLGVKPLFYAADSRRLVFGSEVKAVLASGEIDRDLDLEALGEFLAWEYIPAPRTLLRRVRKLRPAELLDLDLDTGRLDTRIWWRLPPPGIGEPRSAGEWADAVDAKLGEAVRAQLVSDVPLGAFLSGGVDSSLVVAHMGEARTFSIGFDDPSYNEAAWADRVASHLGVNHRVEIIRPDIVPLFEKLMYFMDDPIGDFSIFPTFLVSRLARSEVTVALSGDGGDELFGGYETYVAQTLTRAWSRLPSLVQRGVARPLQLLPPSPAKKGLMNKLRRLAEGLGHPAGLEHARWRLFLGEELRKGLFTPQAQSAAEGAERHILDLFEEAGDRPELDRQLYVDMKSYLAENCLTKVDRMSMACSLEARVPFLDHEVAELAFQIPEHLKLRGRTTKPLLKEVAARYVPRGCVYRPKQGFSIPIKHWLRGEFRPLMEELLSVDRIRAGGLFQPATVDRLRWEHLAGRANHSHILWSLMVFQEWRRRWGA